MLSRRDLKLTALAGFLIGWLVVLPAKIFGLTVTPAVLAASVVGFTLLALLAIITLAWLNGFWGHFFEIGKFAAVGALNSFIDLTVLDVLMLATGATAGPTFIVIKGVAFVAAAVNSYFWNKFWTFGSRLPVSAAEGVRFAVFTVIGAVLNTAVAYIVVTYISAPAALTPDAWANIAAAVAILANMTWNFLTYRRFVFPRSAGPLSAQDMQPYE